MRRFNHDNAAYGIHLPEEFSDDLSEVFYSLTPRVTGSLITSQNPATQCQEKCEYILPLSSSCHVFPNDDVLTLTQLLVKLLSLPNQDCLCVNAVYRKYKCVTVKNVLYKSSSKRNSSIALAEWDDELFGPPPTPLTSTSTCIVNPEDNTLRPVRIEHVMISFSLDTCLKILCFAVVSCFQPHLEIGKPAQVWCKQLFECHSLSSFLPVYKLHCRCVYLNTQLHEENFMMVAPLITQEYFILLSS